MGNSPSVGQLTSVATGVVTSVLSSVLGLLGIFQEKPEVTNDTMQAIQQHIDRQQRDLEQRAAEVEKRAQEHEADRQRAEAVLTAVRQSHEEVVRQNNEAARASAALLEETVRQNEEAAKRREEDALRMEAAAKLREEAALAEAEKAKETLRQGIRPVVMPSLEQFSAAKRRIQFDPSKLHFAVCGTSGSGKSSIINAVRGLGSKDHDSARVGVTECTSEITRFPDPRQQTPYSRFVWYDIPGAGTTAVPDWQYFNDQGLFVFDFIVMVYDVRFTTIDKGIIENCLRFNIPVFIVRSKADQHIANMMQARECEPGDEDYDEVYREMVKEYVEATRSDFDKHMQDMAAGPELDARDRQLLLNQRVYIVAGPRLRCLLQTTTSNSRRRAGDVLTIIDEALLVEDMLRAAARRRYRTHKPVEIVESLQSFAQRSVESLIPALMRTGTETG